jgi:hypothetical protein
LSCWPNAFWSLEEARQHPGRVVHTLTLTKASPCWKNEIFPFIYFFELDVHKWFVVASEVSWVTFLSNSGFSSVPALLAYRVERGIGRSGCNPYTSVGCQNLQECK